MNFIAKKTYLEAERDKLLEDIRISVNPNRLGSENYVLDKVLVGMFQGEDIYIQDGNDKDIDMWSLNELRLVSTIKNAHNDRVTAMAYSERSEIVVSGSNDNTIKVWNMKEKTLIHAFTEAHSDWVTSVVISKEEDIIVSTSFDQTIGVWSLKL